MRDSIILASIMLFSAAHAGELVARAGSNEVRLQFSPCLNAGILSQVDPAARPKLQAATGRIAGKTFAACWARLGDSAVLLYEDGDEGLIPMRDFKESLGV